MLNIFNQNVNQDPNEAEILVNLIKDLNDIDRQILQSLSFKINTIANLTMIEKCMALISYIYKTDDCLESLKNDIIFSYIKYNKINFLSYILILDCNKNKLKEYLFDAIDLCISVGNIICLEYLFIKFSDKISYQNNFINTNDESNDIGCSSGEITNENILHFSNFYDAVGNCIKAEHMEMIKFLVYINVFSINDMLLSSLILNSLAVAKYLISIGAIIDDKSIEEYNIFVCNSIIRHETEVTKICLSIKELPYHGFTIAIEKQYLDIIKLYLFQPTFNIKKYGNGVINNIYQLIKYNVDGGINVNNIDTNDINNEIMNYLITHELNNISVNSPRF
jgi:hypothetical protein